MSRVIFTCGDINGIGPEISIKLFSKLFSQKSDKSIAFICPVNVFEHYYKKLNVHFKYHLSEENLQNGNSLNLIPFKNKRLKIGKPTKESGEIAYESILNAIELVKSNTADAIVTSPISKTAFQLAGINFPGHTELLAASEKQNNFLMMFLSQNINAGLLTIHEPIKKVPSLITKKRIIDGLSLINRTLKEDFRIDNPKIAVLGLNPHAGENGNIGREETDMIIPAIKSFGKKINVEGPFVPDAFWATRKKLRYDFVLGMYHDQVLIPFKMLNFDKGVNYTAGLRMIRTSPDHGTAFDIAGKGIASETSLYEAYRYAIKIHSNRIRLIEN